MSVEENVTKCWTIVFQTYDHNLAVMSKRSGRVCEQLSPRHHAVTSNKYISTRMGPIAEVVNFNHSSQFCLKTVSESIGIGRRYVPQWWRSR